MGKAKELAPEQWPLALLTMPPAESEPFFDAMRVCTFVMQSILRIHVHIAVIFARVPACCASRDAMPLDMASAATGMSPYLCLLKLRLDLLDSRRSHCLPAAHVPGLTAACLRRRCGPFGRRCRRCTTRRGSCIPRRTRTTPTAFSATAGPAAGASTGCTLSRLTLPTGADSLWLDTLLRPLVNSQRHWSRRMSLPIDVSYVHRL